MITTTGNGLAGRTRFAIALLLPLLALTAPAAAQETTGSRVDIAGRTLDRATGQPVANAFVGVVGTRRSTHTDANGQFVLRGLDAGRHSVAVELLGYAADTLTAVFEAGASPLEVLLTPDPIVLEGLQVMNDRLLDRRRSVATSVRAFDAERLRSSGVWDLRDFVRLQVFTRPCPNPLMGDICIARRGRAVAPSVYINEARVAGGLEFLIGYPPEEIYLVEIYSGGTHIRVYTNWYAERLATGRARLLPVLFD